MERDEFRKRLKEEWRLLSQELFDDRVRAEGIAVRDYPLLLVDRGFVVFANRDAKTVSFSEIVDFWVSQNVLYAPDASVGGLSKFIRLELRKLAHPSATKFEDYRPNHVSEKQQLKKGGRGWLHK